MVDSVPAAYLEAWARLDEIVLLYLEQAIGDVDAEAARDDLRDGRKFVEKNLRTQLRAQLAAEASD